VLQLQKGDLNGVRAMVESTALDLGVDPVHQILWDCYLKLHPSARHTAGTRDITYK
jgi:hypothetical protein